MAKPGASLDEKCTCEEAEDLVARLKIARGVHKAEQGEEVTADFWKGSGQQVQGTLDAMSRQLGTQVNFIVRARG